MLDWCAMTILLALFKSYWPHIAAFFIAIAIGFSLAWNIQGMRLDSLENVFKRYQNEVEQNAIAAKRAVMDKENFWRTELENARINANAREMRLKKDVAAAQSATNGLRNDLASLRARLTTSTEASCLATADSIGILLGQCAEDYRAMAEVADRHATDVQTLTEAWPK